MLAEEHDEPDWLAFRYAAGDMGPDEARAFEARLADDQEAREALSRAVRLAERLGEAAPSAPERVVAPGARMLSRLRLRRGSLQRAAAPAGWMAVGAAAALLIASLIGWPARPTIETPPGSSPSEGRSSPPTDVLVWARFQARHDGGTADLEHWLDEAASEAISVATDDAADRLETPELPSWVFTVAPQPQKRGMP